MIKPSESTGKNLLGFFNTPSIIPPTGAQMKSSSKHTSHSARFHHKTAQTSASLSVSDSISASASMGPFPVPSKPAYIFSNCRNFLTDYEESEILNYREVYYIRPEPVQSKKSINQIPNFFHFVKNDHIAYRYQQLQVIGKGSFGSVFE